MIKRKKTANKSRKSIREEYTKTKLRYVNESVPIKSSTNMHSFEKSLKQLQDLQSSILSAIPHAVIGLKDRTIFFANEAVERVFGWKPDEIIGKNTRQLYRNDKDYEEIGRRFYPLLEKQSTHTEDFPCMRKDGQEIICRISASVIGKEMSEKDIVVMYEDITERRRTEEKIRESEDRYRNLFENANDMIQSVLPDGHFDFVNPLWLKTMGYTMDDLQKLTIFDILYPSCMSYCKELFLKVMSGESIYGLETTFVTKDGRRVDIEGSVNPRLIDGKVVASHAIFRDVTERKRAAEEMKKLSTAVEQSSDWILITDREGNVEYVNKAVEQITGYKKEEIIGQNPRILKSGKHDEKFYKKMWDTILSGRSYVGIITNRKKNGELFDIYHTITPLKDDKGNITHFVATSKDITQQKLMEEKINYLAYYDTLTELPNRTLFTDRLNQSIARIDYDKRLVGVLVINLDRFKLINDTFGPKIGDDVLKEIAKRLSVSVREGDTVARLGSDEFGITLAAIAHSEDIILIVEKLMKIISQAIKANEEEILITPGIGISVYPNDGRDVQTLIQNADIALSNAKEQGGNNYQFYTQGMNKKASELILMERQLFNALNNDEFVLQYQPYWDINTKKIAGMEALVRWQSSDKGLVPPGKFIPVLEETKMIIEVGEWILRTAVRQVREWQNKGHPVVPISVNLSLIQFRQKDLAEMVKKVMEEFGLNTSLLTLEITESAFMQDIDFTKSVLKTLKEIGCSISIDDFGTGYSSLSYLKRFPVDNLKIDISFIREIATDPDTASIVTAIIGMAHTLNIKTIAEGVETEEQWKILRLLRCDVIQGYYLSKPLPAEEIERIFKQQ
jgi:diguanylate cyclase (GGDEF)-like protein/PAS domain S-box-containing protein